MHSKNILSPDHSLTDTTQKQEVSHAPHSLERISENNNDLPLLNPAKIEPDSQDSCKLFAVKVFISNYIFQRGI